MNKLRSTMSFKEQIVFWENQNDDELSDEDLLALRNYIDMNIEREWEELQRQDK